MALFRGDSPIFGIAIIALCIVVGAVISKYSRFYREILLQDDSSRFGHIDGVRGYLALSVFLTHALSAFNWYRSGRWQWPSSSFYTLCGQVPVSLFFMITGYLFWKKAMKSGGRMDLPGLYISRLKRLAPLYLAAVPLVFILVGIKSGWTLQVAKSDLVGEVGSWLVLGIARRHDINGVRESWVLNPSLWTLQYEWFFYLALPAMAVFATGKRLPALLLGGVIATSVMHAGPPALINFLFGMAAAQYFIGAKMARTLRGNLALVISMAGLLATGLFSTVEYGVWQSILIFPFFLYLLAGGAVFGLVSCKPARLLGSVSYSIYVVHCVILHGVLLGVNAITPIAQMDVVSYWALMSAVALLIVLVSTLTFRWVEFPFMRKPKEGMVALAG